MDAVAQFEHGLTARPSARLSAMTYSSVEVRAEIEVLFSRHHAEIYAYLARMVREPELAADLAQDTFVKAYRAFDSLEDPDHARAWLYQIAHRVALDEFRRRKIIRFLPWTGESRGAAPSAEHLALEGRFSGDMERALRKIPERQRSALLLAELHDLTGLELAAALGVSHVPFSWLHQATLPFSTAIGVAFGWAGPLGAPEAGGDAIAIWGAVAGPTSCEPTRKATTNVAATAPIAPNGVKPRPWRPRRSAGLATRLGRRAASLSRAADVRAHRSRGGAGGRSARSSARCAAYSASTLRHSAQSARCSSSQAASSQSSGSSMRSARRIRARSCSDDQTSGCVRPRLRRLTVGPCRDGGPRRGAGGSR